MSNFAQTAVDRWGKKYGVLEPIGDHMAQERRDLEISLRTLISQSNKAVIEVLADDRRKEFMLYNMLARMTAGRLLGLNSGDWSIMLGGFALIGMVILLL